MSWWRKPGEDENIKCLCFLPDEKEKYDPNSFRDAIIQGLSETEGDLEKVTYLF